MDKIRLMTIDDIPRAAEIHVFGWRHTYRGIVSDDILFNKMSVARSTQRFADGASSGDLETYVYDDGIIKGFMTVFNCLDEDTTDSFEIVGLYIDPFMQRGGVGAKMIRFCEEIAAERGFSKVCLWVLTENANARAFYEKMGYMPDGASKFLDGLDAWEVRYAKNIG